MTKRYDWEKGPMAPDGGIAPEGSKPAWHDEGAEEDALKELERRLLDDDLADDERTALEERVRAMGLARALREN